VFAFVLFIVFILVPRHKSHESVKIGPHPRGHPSSTPQKVIHALELRKEGEKPQSTLATKEATSPDSTYLEKMKSQKQPSLLGRKKISSQEVTSMMMHCFFELSHHPLQG
jgi:hypothetical protein